MSASEQKDGVPPTGRDVRSSSPAKRAAPEAEQDVEMSSEPTTKEAKPQTENADQMDTTGSEDGSTGNDGNSASDNAYQTPSSMSTYTAPVAGTQDNTKMEASVSPEERPSFDDQVARVTCFMMQPLQEGQKGYVVSMSWLKRVLARSSTHADKMDKEALEGEIGQVDNSDLVLVTDPVNTGFKDERNQPFIALRPGLQMGEDFEVVPQEGWDLIMQWYGLAEQSPAIIRYAHNTVPSGDSENIQYELNPPVFTLLKLSNPSEGVTPTSLRDKNKAPVKTLASRHANFQAWLRSAKQSVNVDTSVKVRVWRILGGLGSTAGSAAITPAASRSNSPAPFSSLVSSSGSSYVLDLNTFLSLSEGSQRELLDVKDQSVNANYNGKMTVDLAGLGEGGVIVLEESVALTGNNSDWVSELSTKTLNRLGVPSGNLKANKSKNKSPATSGRSSPALEPIRKTRKDGKPRGNTGLSNLGNTCYMNSALQCVRSVEELTYYFLNDIYKEDLNPSNPLAHNGEVAKAYANLLRTMYDTNGQSSFAPRQLKNTIGRYGPAFSGYGQQDSQEFLLFLLDGLQEDLNRIQKKPYIEKPDSTDEMTHNRKALEEFADKCWDIYKARNDSVVTDLFAGMYKSTLVCPTCEKVSIIFDPFNNLTLQLPIENLWSKSIFFFPHQKKPIMIDIEIDKNSSVKALKELIAKKTDTDPERLIMSEIYKNKFYKMFDNTSSMAECQIGDNDDIGVFEVESVPTNYNPDKPTKTSYYSYGRSSYEEVPKFESPKADRMIISLFNRHDRQAAFRKSRQFFGVPSYIIINREEATDYDTILRKILAQIATMTTRDFLNETVAEEEQETAEDSDTVIMNEDDAESADSKIKTASVDGEDGMVDVSMRDADQADAKEEPTDASTLDSSIPARFHGLFDIKIARTNEAVPLGFSSVDENKDYNLMKSRIQPKAAIKEDEKSGSDESSEEKDDDNESDDEIDVLGNTRTTTPKPRKQRPLINPGEAIVLDWFEEPYEALFTGDHRDPDGPRGAPTWTNIDRLPDPELTSKRQLRNKRKKKGVTLYECLDEFNKEEILSENDAWYCPRCKEHRRASKKFELWKTPDILVMHLKRFSASRGFRDKLDIMVDFPTEGLDLTGRVEAPEDGKSLIYDLFAVDNHYGGLGGGHYTAYAKNFMTGQWNEYNDSSVSRPIDPQNAVTSSAYLLFYRRRSDRPLGGKILEEITESSTRPNTESDSSDSRPPSPDASASGEGRRLGGSSRNGSSSALAGVGAAHQLGDGGLRIGTRNKSRGSDGDDDDNDNLPGYTNSPAFGEHSFGTGMDLNYEDDGEGDYGGTSLSTSNPFHHESTWSFSRVPDSKSSSYTHHGLSQMNMATELPGSLSLSDDPNDPLNINLDDSDNDSNKAVGGGNVSDSDYRMASFADSPPFEGSVNPHLYPGTPLELDNNNDNTTDMPDLQPLVDVTVTETRKANGDTDDDDDDEELPVVELHVGEEDRLP